MKLYVIESKMNDEWIPIIITFLNNKYHSILTQIQCASVNQLLVKESLKILKKHEGKKEKYRISIYKSEK